MFETDKLLIEGISINTSEECLKQHIERITGLAVKEITYGTKGTETEIVNSVETRSSTGELRTGVKRNVLRVNSS